MGLGDFLGSMFSGLAGAPDGAHVRILNELKPWVLDLLPAASRKWLPRIMSGGACEVPIAKRGVLTGELCDHLAVEGCGVCHRPVCLSHSFINQHGDAICYICVADATKVVPPVQRDRQRQQGAPPPREHQQRQPPPQPKQGPSALQIVEAFQTLGLKVKPAPTWAVVKAAHRKLSAQNHPDRHKTARAKASAEARFVEIQQAFDTLKTQYAEGK